MSPINKIIQKLTVSTLMVVLGLTAVQAQVTPPTWWFGVSGAANFNFYDGTTQRLNNSLIVPTAFHKGTGVKPYGSIFAEYRPGNTWGLMLNVAYDGRGAKFTSVEAPCNCPATLSTNVSYVAIEPSLRLGFAPYSLYFFAGPRVAFNVDKEFAYTQLRQPNTDAQFSAMHNTIVSGQVGVGYDILLSSANSVSKVTLSPFVSYHPYFGQEPRSIESLSITTVRAGIALKFGKGHKKEIREERSAAVIPVQEHDFVFSARGPKTILLRRQVSETLPLLNSVFFEEGSDGIPARYITLSGEQAASFKEEQLQNEQAESMHGRSAGQLNVYHNILNILGDRMRSNPGAVITLNGSSAKGPEDARELALSIKHYLVTVFGIAGSRISVTGGYKAHPSSEQPGGTKDLELLHAEDRRVDIETRSPELLIEVGGGMMKPVQIVATQVDPLDSQVVFDVDSARELNMTWSVDATDERGVTQHYGPFTSNEESLPGSVILGSNPAGDYKIVMTGVTKKGTSIRKESSIHLVREDDKAVEKGYRYSIVFDFDKSKSIAEYNKFLTDIVAPLVTDGATVIIHGHTDIIGSDEYNQKLSENRARETQKVIERALTGLGRGNVKFETFGFGEDISHAPFENNLPEERFYNRTVVIDIVPVK